MSPRIQGRTLGVTGRSYALFHVGMYPFRGGGPLGDLLRFWRQHGGWAVLGAPLSEVLRGTNGDGSGRVYALQYFQNARLDLHPETRDPRDAVLPGLLGHEDLVARGWVTP